MELFEYELSDIEKKEKQVKNNINLIRTYQERSIQRSIDILDKKGNPLVIQATGTGKTITMAGLIYRLLLNNRKKVIVLSHREELVLQNADKINWITGMNVGIEKASIKSNNERIISASVQSLNDKRLDRLNADYLVIDECFTGDTLIDGIPIKDIRKGDLVSSYNHKTNTIEKKEVVTLFRKEYHGDWYNIKVNGKEIVCTSNHPFYTKKYGYISADKIYQEVIDGVCYNDITFILNYKEGYFVTLDSINRLSDYKDRIVYNIEVKDNNNYFANGVLVHNCHHSTSKSYKKVIESFGCPLIGYTATPDRTDGQGLGINFTDIAMNYSLLEAIKDGWLCPIKGLKLDLDVNLNDVKTSKGDFDNNDLARAIDPHLHKIAKGIIDNCKDKKTIVFMASVEQCYQLQDILNEAGHSSLAMDGKTKDRQTGLKDFYKGKYKCLINMNLFTEGFDAPFVDCIVMARPTKSRSLYSQMVGRGTRLHHGKEYCLLIEFTYNYTKHNLVNVYELFMTENFNEKVRSKAIKEEPVGELFDILDNLNNSFENTYHVKSLLDKINSTKLKGEYFNPFEVMALAKIDIDGEIEVYYQPKDSESKFKLNNKPYSISEKQKDILINNKFDTEYVITLSKAQASKIIDVLFKSKNVNNLIKESAKNW
jgi:superfamily II DNA or RNA helicase